MSKRLSSQANKGDLIPKTRKVDKTQLAIENAPPDDDEPEFVNEEEPAAASQQQLEPSTIPSHMFQYIESLRQQNEETMNRMRELEDQLSARQEQPSVIPTAAAPSSSSSSANVPMGVPLHDMIRETIDQREQETRNIRAEVEKDVRKDVVIDNYQKQVDDQAEAIRKLQAKIEGAESTLQAARHNFENEQAEGIRLKTVLQEQAAARDLFGGVLKQHAENLYALPLQTEKDKNQYEKDLAERTLIAERERNRLMQEHMSELQKIQLQSSEEKQKELLKLLESRGAATPASSSSVSDMVNQRIQQMMGPSSFLNTANLGRRIQQAELTNPSRAASAEDQLFPGSSTSDLHMRTASIDKKKKKKKKGAAGMSLDKDERHEILKMLFGEEGTDKIESLMKNKKTKSVH